MTSLHMENKKEQLEQESPPDRAASMDEIMEAFRSESAILYKYSHGWKETLRRVGCKIREEVDENGRIELLEIKDPYNKLMFYINEKAFDALIEKNRKLRDGL